MFLIIPEEKLKNSFTFQSGLLYENHYFNIGLDFFYIASTYYFYQSAYAKFNHLLGEIDFYAFPVEQHFKPYKQLQYRVNFEINPFLYSDRYLNTSLDSKHIKFYFTASSLNHFYNANINQKTLTVWRPSFDASSLNYENNIVFINNDNYKTKIEEKGYLIGFRMVYFYNKFEYSISLKQIYGNAYLIYYSDTISLFARSTTRKP
ncbi:MAG: hypothetical protein KatS3mg129_1999 [Leptospiraceae bacterium]|nr:MAG: hypothetical protein KatS3mg129_1999 [Leptospiraceae bacterium]